MENSTKNKFILAIDHGTSGAKTALVSVLGEVVDSRSDIFSLGVLLYEMTTGRRPFRGDTSAELMSSILRDTPPPVTEVRNELPDHLGRILKRCLEKDPNRRCQSALDLKHELEDVRSDLAPVG